MVNWGNTFVDSFNKAQDRSVQLAQLAAELKFKKWLGANEAKVDLAKKGITPAPRDSSGWADMMGKNEAPMTMFGQQYRVPTSVTPDISTLINNMGGMAPQGMGLTGMTIGPSGKPSMTIGPTADTKTQEEVKKSALKNLDEYASSANDVLGALGKIEKYAEKLPEFKPGFVNQTMARGQIGLGEYSADKVFSEYSGVLSSELIPMARKLQEEKGPITEWDVARVEKGLGQKNLPLEQKKVIIGESRKKVQGALQAKWEAAGMTKIEFAKKYPKVFEQAFGKEALTAAKDGWTVLSNGVKIREKK